MKAMARHMAIVVGAYFSLLSSSLLSSTVAAEEVRGYASVKSGNTILIGKRILRLFGVSAPKIDIICQNEMRRGRLVTIDPTGGRLAFILQHRIESEGCRRFRDLI